VTEGQTDRQTDRQTDTRHNLCRRERFNCSYFMHLQGYEFRNYFAHIPLREMHGHN